MSCSHISTEIIKSKIITNEKIAKDIYLLRFESRHIAENACPGQFINVKIPQDNALILRRPFSIYNVEKNIVSIIYMVVGQGTKSLSETREGAVVNVLGPLGSGFEIHKKHTNAILVGGGCGTPPLYFLARQLVDLGLNVYPFLGYGERDKIFLDREMFNLTHRVFVSTDDASHELSNLCTHHGTIIDLLKTFYNENTDMFSVENTIIYSCGPAPLLSAVKKFANEKGFRAQISMEEYMGCGFGVCLGCAVKTTDGAFKYVCKDGPVFDVNEVEI